MKKNDWKDYALAISVGLTFAVLLVWELSK